VFTAEQLKLPGPVQPVGSVPKVPEIAKPDIGRPSLDANVMLTVRRAPMTTDTTSEDGVATTKSSVPERTLPPLNPTLPVPPVPVVGPLELTAAVPLLLPLEPEPQPDNSASATQLTRSERCMSGEVMLRTVGLELTASRNAKRADYRQMRLIDGCLSGSGSSSGSGSDSGNRGGITVSLRDDDTYQEGTRARRRCRR
jgi:hypothetical protein